MDTETLQRTFVSIARSTTCVTTTTVLYGYLLCNFRNLVGHHNRLAYFIAGWLASSLGTLIEKPARRYELALYGSNIGLETLFLMMMARGWIKPIKNGMVYVFAATFSLLLYYYRHKSQYLTYLPNMFMDLLVGREGKQDFLEKKLFKIMGSITGENNKRSNQEDKSKTEWNMQDVLIGGAIRNFLYGYLIQQTINMLKSMISSKNSIFTSISNNHSNAKQFGIFLGLLGASSRGLPILLNKLLLLASLKPKNHQSLITILSGFLSGLTAFLWSSTDVTMYLLVRGLEAVANEGIDKKMIPKIPYFVELLYGFSSSLCLYGIVFERYTVRASYTRFLEKATDGEISHFAQLSPHLAKASGLPTQRPSNWWF
eukprot:TRINITY_DN10525_c0_g1_i2.p1 TRINITY_DN10525_c0_g1~~TRINITY_DN10525_c0_g1_i2.p1  ORF type:complete len:429 (+),score=56.25 TRINITY_DN10525_c0_g1_i2:177-1289(+)